MVVYFDFDKWKLTDESRLTLDYFFRGLQEKKVSLTIKGHCDAKGSEGYNDVLSEKKSGNCQKLPG